MPRNHFFHAIMFAILLCFPRTASEAADESPAIGTQVANLEFKDIRFLTRSLADFKAKKALVIVAASSSCPIAKRYMPVLAAMDKEYRQRGVQFLALHADDDSITEIAAASVESEVTFPVVKDIDARSTRALGLARTPQVVVLDTERRIRYRGRIDDQFRLGGDRPTATDQPLRDAIEDLLAGRSVAREETAVDGCLITAATTAPSAPAPTFAEDVAPIVQKHCQDCHHEGGTSPFPLVSYRDVASQAAMIAEVVADRRMPPWYASERHGEFANRRGLDEAERETILRWVESGSRKGDPAKLPAPRTFPKGPWQIGEPDLVTTMPLDHNLPATGFIDYKYAVFPHIFTQDTWVEAVEILPDNPRVVHHANLAFMKLGERPKQENFITGRVPGGDPMVLDEGTCVLIPKGSLLGLQIHYTTTGKPERARISVGLRFPRAPVRKKLYIEQVHTTRFKIPPLDPAHPVTARRKLNFDATGVGLFSHMHVRGKDMTFRAVHPDGTVDTLLLIPNYNFDWQQSYRWAPGAKKLPKGSTFEVLAHFDNSEFNPYNPDPKAAVGNGDQTYEEMMYGFYFFTRDDEDLNLTVDPKTGAAK